MSGGINTYVYVEGNPLLYTDPKGLQIAQAGAVGVKCLSNPACRAAIAAAATAAVAKVAQVCSDGIDRFRNWYSQDSSDGEKPASTPTGQRGSPMDVPRGTNEPTTIDGRDYSGHALDQMQGRGIPPTAVEDAIQNGTKQDPGKEPGTIDYRGQNGGKVVTTPGGKVITVW